jgi:hypothetical protein
VPPISVFRRSGGSMWFARWLTGWLEPLRRRRTCAPSADARGPGAAPATPTSCGRASSAAAGRPRRRLWRPEEGQGLHACRLLYQLISLLRFTVPVAHVLGLRPAN